MLLQHSPIHTSTFFKENFHSIWGDRWEQLAEAAPELLKVVSHSHYFEHVAQMKIEKSCGSLHEKLIDVSRTNHVKTTEEVRINHAETM